MSSRTQLSPQDEKRIRLFTYIAFGLATAHVIVMNLYFRGVIGRGDWVHVMFFDLDEEGGLGTWFSTVILLYAGRLLLRQACAVKDDGDRWYRWWFVLAVGFHFLSIDEVIRFHEYVNTVIEHTRWTTFGAIIVAILALVYLPFVRALPSRIRFLFVLAAVIYVGGALGVERATDWYDVNNQLDTLEYNIWTMVEEAMEMAGVIVFIHALLVLKAERTAPSS